MNRARLYGIIVWMAVMALISYEAYKNLINEASQFIINSKSMDGLNGNP